MLEVNVHSVTILFANYFNFGSRKEQIIFARLRLKYSSLKYHIFKKNIIDPGLCTCGKIETTAHALS